MARRSAVTGGHLPDAVVEFAHWLYGLLTALDPESGWYGVFAQRDPDGIQACLDGHEVLPWDVVDSLLRDLAARRGAAAAERERARAERLHRASVTAYDKRAGGREALRDRLQVMLRLRQDAGARQRALDGELEAARSAEEAERLGLEAAWARDDHERAALRCEELQKRLSTLAGAGAGAARRKAPRGARFAGIEPEPEPEAQDLAGPPALPGMTPAVPAVPSPRTPRGARFAGAYEEPRPEQPPDGPTPEVRREVAAEVARLVRLRGEGRGGEAYVALSGAASCPAERLPLFIEEFERAGHAAEVSTLLWEAACLLPERLAEAAAALVGAGRAEESRVLLQQAVSRPPGEVAETALALRATGHSEGALLLLDAMLRNRTPAEAAGVAEREPGVLVPLLLRAAAGATRRRNLVHALRSAGLPGVPESV